MTAECWMCERSVETDARTFYERGDWFAVLAVPPHVRGHAVLARVSRGSCPRGLTGESLAGLEHAISDVVSLLNRHYQGLKNVLVVSIRAKDPHVHLHLIPVWPDEENAWRAASGHSDGYMFTFLGDLEQMAIARSQRDQRNRGWTDQELRAHYAAACKSDRDSLAQLARPDGPGGAGAPEAPGNPGVSGGHQAMSRPNR